MPDKFNWYLIYTKSAAEKKAFQELSAEGYEVFLPLVKKTTTWKNRQNVTSEVPLVPGYLFGKLTHQQLLKIENIKSVASILREHGQRVIIPEEEVELLRKLQGKGIAYQVEDMVTGKDNYMVESVDFQGLKGVLEEGRLYVRLRGIGLGISIKIEIIKLF